MRISTIIDESELPDRFQQVFKIAPKEAWRHRAQYLVARERKNPFLKDYFDERYSIERSLARALEYHQHWGRFPPVRGAQAGRYFELYSFVHILSGVYDRLSPKGQSRVRGYLKGGLKSDAGLAPFAHELAVAAHLWTAGFDLEFMDTEGRARFDILARKGGLDLEVDCKTASGDVGRQIHRRRALELFNRIHPALDWHLEKGGGRTVDIVLPGALHGVDTYMNAVTNAVSDAIAQDKWLSISDVAEVSLGAFELHDEPALIAGPPARQDLEIVAERRLGRANAHVVCVGRPGHGAVVAVVSSRRRDRVVKGIYRELKESAQGQFGGANPALLAIRLLDLTMPQLRELASQGPGNFGAISNRLFARDRRAHLFGVAFVSPADVLTESMGAAGIEFSDRGLALLFRRQGHPLAQDPRLVLFQHH
jgi:hypothetical protein